MGRPAPASETNASTGARSAASMPTSEPSWWPTIAILPTRGSARSWVTRSAASSAPISKRIALSLGAACALAAIPALS